MYLLYLGLCSYLQPNLSKADCTQGYFHSALMLNGNMDSSYIQ